VDLQLQGRVVCVTGGSRGIGRASVLALLREGARVGVCGRDETALQALVVEAGNDADKLVTVRADVRDDKEVRRYVESVVMRFGGIDGLVVNAGSGATGSALSTPTQTFADQFEIKVIAALNTIRAALPYLKLSSAGRIVIVNGVTAHTPDADQAAVSCARAGLGNLAVLLAKEVAGAGICVNRINLGPILSGRQRSRYEESASTVPYEQWIGQEASRRRVPLGRMGEIEEVVPWILMLVSPLASFVTGAEINVSGGLGARV